MKITIAGASGFIGQNLIDRLEKTFNLVCLSRSQKKSTAHIDWRQADLYSFKSTDESLRDCDIAIYLVHSMLPSSKLFQGSFQDTDLFLADNFSKACIKNGVKKIIYLGGLVPTKNISKHLSSRKEVEEVIKNTNIDFVLLRAGMVVGDGGSSFRILKNLILNLPGMILPKWTNSETQTIYIDDLVNVIEESITNNKLTNKTINVVNGEKIFYSDLITQTAAHFKKKLLIIKVPINYTGFSKLWVKIFGETDMELVSPLIDSLLCDLPQTQVPEEIEHLIEYRSYRKMLVNISMHKIKRPKKSYKSENNVRSIQRLANNKGLTENQVSEEYIKWLPRFFKYLITAKRDGDKVCFYATFFKHPLLVLQKIEESGNLNRVKFHIIGGFLVKRKDTGWLEFRDVSSGRYTLASINNFIPSLPWYIYRYTQAIAHSYVMDKFSSHLNKKK